MLSERPFVNNVVKMGGGLGSAERLTFTPTPARPPSQPPPG